MDCVFCAIVRGDLPCSPVFESERVLAFLDIAPATPGHVLVVPRAHATGLAEVDPEDASQLMVVAQQLAGALRRSAVPTDGINLLLADGEVAGQEVFHVHLHVVPRTGGDGFQVSAEFSHPARVQLDATAAHIRAAL
ncbi:HIT family protein [Ornithinimicrobium cerasi]|uniref:Histidine triad (HIT) family protein n=1 Tax=Ornithinimicrobium cerasi TaxID=2248773 RepID=A0A285VN18_9MICO|nr:HIT family protein [Ornithinimicrobium cerasi]SOC55287.1 histidine triad (HIT) family protein [Ornithinimicrobium cerasi]